MQLTFIVQTKKKNAVTNPPLH